MSRDITTASPVPADQRHAYGADPSQFFELFIPKLSFGAKPRGSAIMIHGGFWRAKYDLAHASHLCAAFAAAGIATANLEYRRVGNGGGWPATFHDLRAGLAAVRKHFAAAPVATALGHSAGGHLALRLAADPDSTLKGVVALAPVADLQLAYELHLSNDAVVEFLGSTPAEKPEAYADADAARHASNIPRALIHGTHDDVVPIALSQSFVAQRRADRGRVELVELADAGHFDLIDPASRAWPVVLDSVGKLLQD
jgi:acetyl esterase/lipase